MTMDLTIQKPKKKCHNSHPNYHSLISWKMYVHRDEIYHCELDVYMCVYDCGSSLHGCPGASFSTIHIVYIDAHWKSHKDQSYKKN